MSNSSSDSLKSQIRRVRVVQLLSQYQVMIQAQARTICGDWQLAEDVYQEVAMILAKDPDAVPEDDGVIPWIREVTRRKSLEWARKHRRISLSLINSQSNTVVDAYAEMTDDFTVSAQELGLKKFNLRINTDAAVTRRAFATFFGLF